MRSLTLWRRKTADLGVAQNARHRLRVARSVTERPDLLFMQIVADPDQDRCPGTFARCSLHRSALTKTQEWKTSLDGDAAAERGQTIIVITSILTENTLYTGRSHQGTCERNRGKLYSVLGRRDHSDSMGDLPLAASNSDRDLLFRRRCGPYGFHKVFTIDVLKHDVKRIILLAHVVDRDDIRMNQSPHRHRFPSHATPVTGRGFVPELF